MTPASAGEPSDEPVFADLLDLMPCPAFEAIIDPPGVGAVTYMNRSAREMFGIELEQARGRTVRDVAGVDVEASELRRMYAELIEGSGYYELEASQVMPGGHELNMRSRMRARQVDGRWRLIGTVEDVTDARRLRLRVDVLMALIDLAPDAILALDARGRITLWNKGAEATYGFTGEEALGGDPMTLLKTEIPAPREDIGRAVAQVGRWEGDIVQTTKDGRRLNLVCSLVALRDEDGAVSAMLAVYRDVTERLALEAERERARLSERFVRAERLESLGQLAGGIAHDFNNLLAVIAGYTTLIDATAERLTGAIDEQARRGLLENSGEIARAVEHGGDLTHQLLAFARQETVRPVPVSLNDVVSDLESMLRRTLGEHVVLETSLAPALGAVLADAGQLAQVLVNLAVNARDAMPDGGRLIIETANVEIAPEPGSDLAAGHGVRLRVTDTGAGMAPEVLEHAFDPFFTTKADTTGTGLGLSTVYGIVTQAGGRASLYSEPGHGTAFTATFPVTDAPALPAAPPALAPAQGDEAGGRTVLLVDDQPALRAVTARILGRAGYDVLAAANGPEALELAETRERIDVLLTDVVMPEMLGQQLAELLRERRPTVRVIFISGFARPALEHGGRPLDGPLLQKPFSAGELLAQVAETLRQP